MLNRPTVSVVLCTYNGARFLREQLDSVVNQTYAPCEILIHDDGSTDGTAGIVAEYAARDVRVKWIPNDGPHGINGNFFTGMRRACGNLIALCDQDDRWMPDKLELQVAALGDAWLCSGRSVPFSEGGYPVGTDVRYPNFHLLRVCYLGVLPGHTLLFRRELLHYLPRGEQAPYLYDWQLQLVAAAAGRIVYVDRVLVNWRRHAGAATAIPPTLGGWRWATLRYLGITLFRHARLQRAVRQRFRFIAALLDTLPFDTEALRDGREMAALQCSRSVWGYLQFTRFCLKHRHRLFHTSTTGNALLDWLRACYFPLSCGWYYRGVLRKTQTS